MTARAAVVPLLAGLLAGPADAFPVPRRADAEGFPLPPGAARRLGSARFREPHPGRLLGLTADRRVLVQHGWVTADEVVGRDPGSGRLLWRRAVRDGQYVADAWVDPAGVHVVVKLADGDFRVYRVDGRTGDLGPDPVTLGLPPARTSSRGVRVAPGLRWVQVNEYDTVERDGLEETVVTSYLFDRAGKRPAERLPDGAAYLFAPDGRHALLARGDQERGPVVDLETGKTVRTASPRDAEFAPAAARLAPPWDAGAGGVRDRQDPPGDPVALAFTPAGRLRVVVGRRVVTYDPETGRELGRSGELPPFRTLRFSPDGARLLLAGDEKSARVCDAGTGKVLATLGPLTAPPRGLCFSPDGTRAYTVDGRFVREWDAAGGAGRRLWYDKADTFPGGLAAVSPDGRTLVYHGCDSLRFKGGEDVSTELVFWDLTGTADPRRVVCPGYYPMGLAFTADGRRLVTVHPFGDPGSDLQVRDAKTGELLHRHRVARAYLHLLAVTADGAAVAVADTDHRLVRVLDPATGAVLRTLAGHDGRITDLAFSPDGRWLASASADAPVLVWRVR